ncbi:MAG TPA: hypothetical protein VFR04_00930, partial [Solirubrobacterales bacterium]|nr:hypothetical protein [Solirubrobacterales bacterium]
NCQGRGAIQQCDVHEAKADGLPWTAHTVGTEVNGDATVTITTGTITTTLTGFLCPHTIHLTPGTLSMLVKAAEVKTTSTATLSGTLVSDFIDEKITLNLTFSGTFHVLGTITYGV